LRGLKEEGTDPNLKDGAVPSFDVETLLHAVNAWPEEVVYAFLHGGCFRFYMFVQRLFPQAEAWYDQDHVLVKVGDRVFDASGPRKLDGHALMTDAEKRKAPMWGRRRHAGRNPCGEVRDMENTMFEVPNTQRDERLED
jgi:hypothetical protein